MNYDNEYYDKNDQNTDRPALLMYERIWRRYLGKGPVLDFGCGLGFYAKRLARYTQVFGLETNPLALRYLGDASFGVFPINTTLNLEKHSIGSVTALHVFEHIADDDLTQVGAELLRVIKPGGRILAVMPDLNGSAHALKGVSWGAFTDPTHINLKTAEEWRILFEKQWKFDVVACFADGYYDFPYGSSRLRSAPGDALRALRTLIQFLIARPFLRKGDGENIIFILEKKL